MRMRLNRAFVAITVFVRMRMNKNLIINYMNMIKQGDASIISQKKDN
jgi:hypothetical protein